MSLRRFRLDIPGSAVDDLRHRLARTRFPDQASEVAPWSAGTDLNYMRELVAYWCNEFDWFAQQARLNKFPQYKIELAGIDLHFLYVRGKGPSPLPLLLSHGWPGSVFEFLDLIPRLTDPARFGGDPSDSFTVIAPSLPGFGISFTPYQPRLGLEAIADCFTELATDVLGYDRFGVQGGDWGAFISALIAKRHRKSVSGIHLNFMPTVRSLASFDNPTPEEQSYLNNLSAFLRDETGYQAIQGTRPQTLAFGLTDSPAGLAAWIVEKFRSWSDCSGQLDSVISKDQLLANISLYWFTGAIGSSFWPYYARSHGPWPLPENESIDVPTGYCEFPAEIIRPPRSLAARLFTNIQRWTVMPKGGHFAAMEQPESLAQEIREFFKPLRR